MTVAGPVPSTRSSTCGNGNEPGSPTEWTLRQIRAEAWLWCAGAGVTGQPRNKMPSAAQRFFVNKLFLSLNDYTSCFFSLFDGRFYLTMLLPLIPRIYRDVTYFFSKIKIGINQFWTVWIDNHSGLSLPLIWRCLRLYTDSLIVEMYNIPPLLWIFAGSLQTMCEYSSIRLKKSGFNPERQINRLIKSISSAARHWNETEKGSKWHMKKK